MTPNSQNRPLNITTFNEISQAIETSLPFASFKSNPDHPRLFSTWEIATYLIPIAPPHFLRTLKKNSALPQGISQTETGQKWFTLKEVFLLRDYFSNHGNRRTRYIPYRPVTPRPKIITAVNSAKESGKTTTLTHYAISAAMDGYRVLVIDLDSQGKITSLFKQAVETKWDTALNLFANNYARHLRSINKTKIQQGDAPFPISDILDAAAKIPAESLIKPTHWPNVDIIGAGLPLQESDALLAFWQSKILAWNPWKVISDELSLAGVLNNYDIVLIDTAPSMGHLTTCAVTTADILLLPFVATQKAGQNTGQSLNVLHQVLHNIQERENITARALGRLEIAFTWEHILGVVTQFKDTAHNPHIADLQQAFGSSLCPHYQQYTPLIGSAGGQESCIFDIDYRDYNRQTYAESRRPFDAFYGYMKNLIIDSWQKSDSQEKPGF